MTARFPNRRSLLAAARAGGSQLILFIPTTEAIPVGTAVKLRVEIDEGTAVFELDGRVQSHIAAAASCGLNLSFDGENKRAAAQMLATCAGRSVDNGTALDSRHPVNVSCVITVRGVHHKVHMKDVSKTGAFINGPVVAGLRRDVELLIHVNPLLGRWGGTELKARVMWVGQKAGMRGFGVRFVDATAHVRETLKKHFPALQK